MSEIWKDIEGYEGLYQISNLGRVKRLGHQCGAIYRNEHLLKPCLRDRYLSVRLSKNGKVKNCNIHRLVASAFIPNPNNYDVVNHIDTNRMNNNVNNLEWCTQSYNCIHAVNNGIASKQNDVLITNVKDNSTLKFKSANSASKYLGFDRQWIAINLKRKGNPFCYKDYKIEVVKRC